MGVPRWPMTCFQQNYVHKGAIWKLSPLADQIRNSIFDCSRLPEHICESCKFSHRRLVPGAKTKFLHIIIWPLWYTKKGKTKMSKGTFVSELQCYWAEDQSWRESYNSFGSNYKQNHKVLPKQKSQGKCSIFVVYPWFPKISEISRKLLKMRRKLELVFPICRLLALLI